MDEPKQTSNDSHVRRVRNSRWKPARNHQPFDCDDRDLGPRFLGPSIEPALQQYRRDGCCRTPVDLGISDRGSKIVKCPRKTDLKTILLSKALNKDQNPSCGWSCNCVDNLYVRSLKLICKIPYGSAQSPMFHVYDLARTKEAMAARRVISGIYDMPAPVFVNRRKSRPRT